MAGDWGGMLMKCNVQWLCVLIVLGLLTAWEGMVTAAPPKTISYQGYLKDGTGTPVTAATNLTFSLYSSTSGAGAVWQEIRSVTPANGVYSVELGTVTPFDALPFDRQHFLGVRAGSEPELRPLQPLTGVPFAFRSGCNAGDMLACYTGPPETLTSGLCRNGTRTCRQDGSGFGRCVGELTPNCNGTCLDFSSNVANCGACGSVCPARSNATATCSSGVCGFTCSSGYANCNQNAADGCETNLQSNVTSCGSCGTVCFTPVHAAATCSGGICGFVCNSGYANCNQNAADGCEANLSNSTTNCGSCGAVCPVRANATATCSSSVCGFACNSGYANCNLNAADGCETNLQTSVLNCGICGILCLAPVHATATCSNGACGFACSSGYANCNLNVADGCETNLQSNVTNCGSCGTVCPERANSTATCSSGVCSVLCNTGWGNCDATVTNGCETNLQTSVTNCGSCGTACARANATSTCSNGVCGFSCNGGYADCNLDTTDGCEADLNLGTSNCGACGRSCAFGYACLAGTCFKVIP